MTSFPYEIQPCSWFGLGIVGADGWSDGLGAGERRNPGILRAAPPLSDAVVGFGGFSLQSAGSGRSHIPQNGLVRRLVSRTQGGLSLPSKSAFAIPEKARTGSQV